MQLPDDAITVQQHGAEVRIIVRTLSESDATALRQSIVSDLLTGRLTLSIGVDNPRVTTTH